MDYHEETCSSCSTQLVPGDPRTRDRCGVYCMRVGCIARNQRTHYENPALEYMLECALRTADTILRNKSNPAKCDHGDTHYNSQEWDWCENCEPVRAHLAMAGAA